jgi:uncharacterized protein (DUF58 family)
MSAAPLAIPNVTVAALRGLVALRARAARIDARGWRAREPRTGQHPSALRGRGMDYAESRPYQPGDDARNIDWRRTARSGKWHTKLFEEDRDRVFAVVLDTHLDMRFGTRVRYKSVAATRAAALATWAVVRAGERAGALAFGALRAEVSPRGGARGALRVLTALAQWSAEGDADNGGEPLSTGLARARRSVPPGGRLLLLSDGWCVDPDAGRALAELARRRDVRALIVTDALERTAPRPGAYVFETASGRVAADLHGARSRAAFADALGRGAARLAEVATHAGVRVEVLDAGAEPDAALARLWRRRGAGR